MIELASVSPFRPEQVLPLQENMAVSRNLVTALNCAKYILRYYAIFPSNVSSVTPRTIHAVPVITRRVKSSCPLKNM